jgi:hypothetical protein
MAFVRSAGMTEMRGVPAALAALALKETLSRMSHWIRGGTLADN